MLMLGGSSPDIVTGDSAAVPAGPWALGWFWLVPVLWLLPWSVYSDNPGHRNWTLPTAVGTAVSILLLPFQECRWVGHFTSLSLKVLSL